MSTSPPVKTILFLASNPDGTVHLRLDREAKRIEQGLERSKRRDHFRLIKKEAVSYDDLRRALLDYEPQIVHFSGHATEDEGLAFEDDTGLVQMISTKSLTTLFGLISGHVECVILNACYSEVQARSISEHINYVIGMKEAIGDKVATKYAVGFYDALGAGRSYEEAHKFGCNAIDMQSIHESVIPIL